VSQEDVERLRDGYAAFNRGDFEAALASMGDEMVIHDRDEVPDPRTYSGTAGALEAFAALGTDFHDYSIEPVEIVDGEDWIVVVARQRGRGKRSGALVEGEIVHLWRLRDGVAIALHGFSTKEDALAAARDPGWPSS
jgi:ketosteroid isomerase-like protein